jgi:hypothetical protein
MPYFEQTLAPFKSSHQDNQIVLLPKTVASRILQREFHESHGTRHPRVDFDRRMVAILPEWISMTYPGARSSECHFPF